MGTAFVGWPPIVTFGPVRAYRALRGRDFIKAADRYKQVTHWLQLLPDKYQSRNLSRKALSKAQRSGKSGCIFSLYYRAEQGPDPDNRVTLSERVDRPGVPEIRLEWKMRPKDIGSVEGWLGVFDCDVRSLGIGEVVFPENDWKRSVIGGPHHMGTTRMSANPRDGVVDADCRVHSVENLYVAGSSVFATGGYANPTFTLVMLALRLADTLHRRLST